MAPSSTPIPGSSEPEPSEPGSGGEAGSGGGSGAPSAGSSARRQELGEDDEKPRAIAGLSEEVVAAAVDGDAKAIGVLFAVLNPRLVRYLGLMVGRDADDVASDTWVEVMRSLPRYVGGADTIGAWVIGIGRHRALTYFRRQKSRPQSAAGIDDFAEILAGESDTHQSVEDSMSTAHAMARIAALPKEQAEAVFLRTIVGLDAVSAGEVLGKNSGAVRTSAHRGLKNLEKQLVAERDADRRLEAAGSAENPAARGGSRKTRSAVRPTIRGRQSKRGDPPDG